LAARLIGLTYIRTLGLSCRSTQRRVEP